MRITLNGETAETDATTLDDLCRELGFGEEKIATARNGDFVPAQERAHTVLSDRDRIEIVAPRQGG